MKRIYSIFGDKLKEIILKLNFTKKKSIELISIIGSIASILGLIYIFLPLNNGNQKINKLYPEIILDYIDAGYEKIKEDFGVPYSNFLDFEGNREILYKLKNGEIVFGGGIKIYVYNPEELKLLLPYLYKSEGINESIILGKNSLGNICELFNINKITSSRGTMNEAKYTEIEYYSGWVGQYNNYTFGTNFTTGNSFSIGESYDNVIAHNDIDDICSNYINIKIDYIKIN